eukprot:1012682_1
MVFKFLIPWLNITALQWILLFAWNDVMIEYLGVAVINIWCVTGILSSFVVLALRNGTYDEFNRKYPAITPFVLVLCVVIALQIFWRACHHSYLFQMVRNPSSLYTECTYWFWFSKEIILVIQNVG